MYKLASKLGVEEFLRVKLGQVGGRIAATPLPRGAGVITSITEADGIIRIPRQSEGIKDNDPVQAELLRPLPAIRRSSPFWSASPSGAWNTFRRRSRNLGWMPSPHHQPRPAR